MKRVLLLLAVLVLVSCVPEEPQTSFVEGSPAEIVEIYYDAWAARDYKTMYSLVSDGWKVLEPTAHTEEDFAAYLVGFYNKAESIRLTFASEQHNTGAEAVVSIAIETELKDGRFVNSNQDLTLRLKKNGWKLIHPYGEYSDLS